VCGVGAGLGNVEVCAGCTRLGCSVDTWEG
jgi:hypothetical protein